MNLNWKGLVGTLYVHGGLVLIPAKVLMTSVLSAPAIFQSTPEICHRNKLETRGSDSEDRWRLCCDSLRIILQRGYEIKRLNANEGPGSQFNLTCVDQWILK